MENQLKCRNCHRNAAYYLVVGCQNKHIADTTLCGTCLTNIKNRYKENQLWCSGEYDACNLKIHSGQYQLINPQGMRITTYNLTGDKILSELNPDYTPNLNDAMETFIETAAQLNKSLKISDETLTMLENLYRYETSGKNPWPKP